MSALVVFDLVLPINISVVLGAGLTGGLECEPSLRVVAVLLDLFFLLDFRTEIGIDISIPEKRL